MKSKTLATWIALVGGSLGLHRFYLFGLRDAWGWLHPWPTLLGWAVVLNWFALSTIETIELSVRPGYYGSRAILPMALVVLPFLSLLVFWPRVGVAEGFARMFALLVGFAGIVPLFMVWPP